MKAKKPISLPPHLQEAGRSPQNREEQLLWIRKRTEEGYYDSEQVKKVVAETLAEAFLKIFPPG